MLRNLSIIAALFLCAGTVDAQTILLRSTTGGGSVRTAGSTMSLQGTIGQAVGGWTTGTVRTTGIGFWYRAGQGTDATGDDEAVPTTLVLGANYPNPFGPGSPSGAPDTRLEFRLAETGHALLAVHDLMGQRRAVLVDERLEAGRYVAVLRAADLPSGVYLCRLVQGTRHAERRLLLLR